MVGTEQRTVSVRDKLRRWNWLETNKRTLEQKIREKEDRIKRLMDRLSPNGILSSIIQQTEDMDMPRPPGYRDKVGNLVAETYARLEKEQAALLQMELELDDICADIQEIEAAIAMLHPRYQQVLTMYYRDMAEWQTICSRLHISKSRLYQMIDIAIEAIDSGSRGLRIGVGNVHQLDWDWTKLD